MRIGFDIDGVLAHFEAGYEKLIVEVTGKNLFPWEPGQNRCGGSPVWDWPQHFGYTNEEVSAVWQRLKDSGTFWLDLDEMPGAAELRAVKHRLTTHDVYYCTSRVGLDCKWQTEMWLGQHINELTPTVLITSEKGLACRVLKLDAYIDDNFDNAQNVVSDSPKTRVYLLDADYNRLVGLEPSVTRVQSVSEFLSREQVN